jgi:hypothetical protein
VWAECSFSVVTAGGIHNIVFPLLYSSSKLFFITSFPLKCLAQLLLGPTCRSIFFLQLPVSLPSFSCAVYSSTLKMEAADSSQILVIFYYTTQLHTSEYNDLQITFLSFSQQRPTRQHPKILWNVFRTLTSMYHGQGCLGDVLVLYRVDGYNLIPHV